jgi:bacterioferritin-associated ferredoxin
MIVCHCKGITDRQIRQAAAAGARSADEIARRATAGTDCGGCRPLIEALLAGREGAVAAARLARCPA